MKINFFFRLPYNFNWSIETIFNQIANNLGDGITVEKKTCPYHSTGIVNRIKSIHWVKRESGNAEINHITGDIHFLAMGLPSSNTILTIHDLSFLKNGNFISRFILWLFWLYIPVKRVKYVTCVSEETKKDVLKYSFCNPTKVVVIPNFVNKGFCHIPKKFNKDFPILLQIGTTYNKNLERLIPALCGLKCNLRIVGRIPERVKAILTKNDIDYSNVYDLNDQEIRDEYVNADMVVFCSTMEGFGLPIIDAQAIGRVVVTSNVSSMPEVAGVNGACLVDPFNSESIREGIKKVIDNDDYRESLIASGLDNVKRFSLQNVANLYLQLYKNVMHSSK
jgi:glycosyltransferase involved in cell wall biosynthesis